MKVVFITLYILIGAWAANHQYTYEMYCNNKISFPMAVLPVIAWPLWMALVGIYDFKHPEKAFSCAEHKQ